MTNLLVCSPIEAYYSCRRRPDSRLAYRPVEFALLTLVARLNAFMRPRYLVLSEHLADVVRAHGASDLRTVPVYGVDFNVYSPGNREPSVTRQDLEVPLHDHLVFFSSRIAPEKDAGTLLEAVRLLRQEDLPITVVHRSGGFEDFNALAESLSLAESVDARDAVPPGPRLADLYRVCDLCVQASRQEGLGFSVLEAMACGTTVVAAAVGGLRETVVDGETGWSYEVGDPHSLASAIRASLTDTEEAACRRSTALSMVRNRYGVDRVFNLLEEALGL
jgi:glycosyltransferase involved in cell wall biosynthesis